MKTSQFRFIAKFLFALFVAILFVFPYGAFAAEACDTLKDDMEYYDRALEDAKDTVTKLEEKGYMKSISQGGWYGLGIGLTAGFVVGLGSGPGVVVTTAKGALSGGISGSIWGGINYHTKLTDARDAVDNYQTKYDEAKQSYEDCEYMHATYKYECRWCNTRWTFEAEEALTNFYHDHQ